MNAHLNALPDKLAEIAEIIGLEAAIKLSDAYPGIRFTVPKSIAPGHPLIAAIGLKPAQKLAEHYGGEALVPPICSRMDQLKRKAQIMAEYGKKSAAQLAREHGVHQFSIYRWAAEIEAAKQHNLFGDKT